MCITNDTSSSVVREDVNATAIIIHHELFTFAYMNKM